ncbi:hypothetical protein PICMEDRAFT_72185 [Pichia membranifaciens NRRL Y-2026]|uniref:Uncharacterized protein n=1 Tax=Pichia membranifaciens NRRL Y-2026 TaxID=763406 RepID=A0A1E3NRM7_9ASCO|nr:hypothetical protein PICMEDRAFT_72185 [Pichia membranifaciens NRRL Y-2026]ODQ48213.1 hypothetical protein PICMEDRAFT_72185 [Pichia membranifaciens NRRL Y-2026]
MGLPGSSILYMRAPLGQLILLIRHGESEGNCDKSVNCYTPNHKIPLTAAGREQAFAAGVKLHDYVHEGESVCFFTSPYQRTRETLQGILRGLESVDAANGVVIHEEPRMREQDFGNFQGTPQEMRQIWLERAKYGHFFYRIPHGESAADVYDRCSSFNDTLFRQFKKDAFPGVLVLVTHGIWARVFLQRWFRWSVEYFEDLQNIPHCRWICLHQQPHHAPQLEGECTYVLETPLDRWSDAPGAADLLVYPYG